MWSYPPITNSNEKIENNLSMKKSCSFLFAFLQQLNCQDQTSQLLEGQYIKKNLNATSEDIPELGHIISQQDLGSQMLKSFLKMGLRLQRSLRCFDKFQSKSKTCLRKDTNSSPKAEIQWIFLMLGMSPNTPNPSVKLKRKQRMHIINIRENRKNCHFE